MLRDKLLQAAARVYAEYGFRGATTRRIADAAGVNEVSLFRHFGSKQALIDAVVRSCATTDAAVELPDEPRRPEAELVEWATAHLQAMREARAMIRKTMGELEERPEIACMMTEGPEGKARGLRRYMGRLADLGYVPWQAPRPGQRNEEMHAAGAMLMGALFADAMGRDIMPEMYPQPAERAAALYVRVFLRAIGCRATRSRAGGVRGAVDTAAPAPTARRGTAKSPASRNGGTPSRSRSTRSTTTARGAKAARPVRGAASHPTRPTSPKSTRT